jgi:predicted acetyltransferase
MGEKLAEQVEVTRASPVEKSLLARLLQLHSHDMSEFNDAELDDDGLFGYEEFDEFWTQRERFPFLVRAGGKVVGFVLVIEEEMDDHTPFKFVADFFIIKKYRRQGIGQAAAFQLFDLFPGAWAVSELMRNVAAVAFWRKVIGRYTEGQFEESPLEDGVIQFFRNPGRQSWKRK